MKRPVWLKDEKISELELSEKFLALYFYFEMDWVRATLSRIRLRRKAKNYRKSFFRHLESGIDLKRTVEILAEYYKTRKNYSWSDLGFFPPTVRFVRFPLGCSCEHKETQSPDPRRKCAQGKSKIIRKIRLRLCEPIFNPRFLSSLAPSYHHTIWSAAVGWTFLVGLIGFVWANVNLPFGKTFKKNIRK